MIGPCRGTDVTLNDHLFWVFGEILKLPASIKRAIAKIVTILPCSFSKANGVEEGASFRSDLVGGSFVVCRDVLVKG